MSTLKIDTARVFTPLLQPSRYKGLWGGRGCVHPDTLIDTPDGQVRIKNFKGGEIHSYHEGKVVIGNATKPVQYPAEDLFRVVFEDGREIIVTDEHKFLTDRGWVQLQHLSKSDACVCEPCPEPSCLPQTTSGTCPSGFREGVRHYLNRVQDYLGGYFGDYRLNDEQLLPAEDSGLVFSQLPSGAQPHNRHALFYGDGRLLSDIDGRSSLFLRHLASLGAPLCAEGRNYTALGNYNGEKPSGLILGLRLIFLLFLWKNTLLVPGLISALLVRVYGTLSDLAQNLKKALGNLFYGALDNSLGSPVCDHDRLILNKIVDICKHSHQPYWDLHVPIYENYLSNGIVNHNSGKSHFFAESAVEHCVMVSGARVVCVREVQKSLKESVKLLIEDKIKSFGLQGSFTILNDHIVTPGGGIIVFNGMADHTAESIKSLEGFDIAYVEEAQTLTERSLELLRPTIRGSDRMKALGRKSEIWFSWNPKNENDAVDRFLRGAVVPSDSIVINSNYSDNPWFPEELKQEREFDEINSPGRYGHVWLGEYEPQAVGAIWTRDVIQRNRRQEAPRLGRILVGVDPCISSKPGSDETGIIVGAMGHDKRGYVLADFSTYGTPRQWAEKAVAAYDLYDADAIVAEVNQGGEMVENTIHSIRPGIKVIPVRATRGKHVRAEPISALYSLDRISHVGEFPKLEMQLCLFTADGYCGNDSADRADAMIWIFHELFPKMTKGEKVKKRPMVTRVNNKYSPHRAYGTR